METYAVEVRVTPRPGILDPEGQTIAGALGNLGYRGISEVRTGRLIRIELEAEDAEDARRAVERMCEELIANPVIEDYEVVVEPPGAASEAGRGSRPRGAVSGTGAGEEPS